MQKIVLLTDGMFSNQNIEDYAKESKQPLFKIHFAWTRQNKKGYYAEGHFDREKNKIAFEKEETFIFYNDYYSLKPLSQLQPEIFNPLDIKRDSPLLLKVAEISPNMKIIEIPDDVEWFISNVDYKEQIIEKHRVWDCDGEIPMLMNTIRPI